MKGKGGSVNASRAKRIVRENAKRVRFFIGLEWSEFLANQKLIAFVLTEIRGRSQRCQTPDHQRAQRQKENKGRESWRKQCSGSIQIKETNIIVLIMFYINMEKIKFIIG